MTNQNRFLTAAVAVFMTISALPLVVGAQASGLDAADPPELVVTEVSCDEAPDGDVVSVGWNVRATDSVTIVVTLQDRESNRTITTVLPATAAGQRQDGVSVVESPAIGGDWVLTAQIDAQPPVSIDVELSACSTSGATSTTTPSTTTTGTTATTSTTTTATSPGPMPPSIRRPTAIAQGVMRFSPGTYRWDHQRLDPSAWPFNFEQTPPVFFVADAGDPLLVFGDERPIAFLSAGEAAFVPAGISGRVAPLSGITAPFANGAYSEASRITIVPDEGLDEGPGTFVAVNEWRDVSLFRAVVDPGDGVSLEALYPVLVVVTDGAFTDASGAVIDASGPVTVGNSVELVNAGDQPATALLVAVVDPFG